MPGFRPNAGNLSTPGEYPSHQRTVYATVLALLVNRQDARDVAQDALLKALTRLNQFRKESIGTWLTQIAISEARMRNRKQWRIPMLSLTDDKDEAKAYVPKAFDDWRDTPSTTLERVEVRDALVKVLGSLARRYREAFVLHDIHELSISETSAILGISPGAVKSRLRRARLMLRDNPGSRPQIRWPVRVGFERSERTMGISCEEIWRDISDYIDDDLDPDQRAALDQHFVECRHCAALLDGTRNVIALYRDQRVLAPPDGFHERLYQRLGETKKSWRRSLLAWTLAAAPAVQLGLALFSARRLIVPAHHTQNPSSEPDGRQVQETVAIPVDQDDRLYHVVGCAHVHGKSRFLRGADAIREGYSPCPICIGKGKPAKKG